MRIYVCPGDQNAVPDPLIRRWRPRLARPDGDVQSNFHYDDGAVVDDRNDGRRLNCTTRRREEGLGRDKLAKRPTRRRTGEDRAGRHLVVDGKTDEGNGCLASSAANGALDIKGEVRTELDVKEDLRVAGKIARDGT